MLGEAGDGEKMEGNSVTMPSLFVFECHCQNQSHAKNILPWRTLSKNVFDRTAQWLLLILLCTTSCCAIGGGSVHNLRTAGK